MSAPRTGGLSAAQLQANRTRAATGPSVQLLSPPSSTGAVSIAADPRFASDGRARIVHGYDLGMPPPPLPENAAGRAVQHFDAAETAELVLERVRAVSGEPTKLARRLSTALAWLSQFDGDTWEQRWLTCGADAAPRSWKDAIKGPRQHHRLEAAAAINALLIARVLRPSYGWQLASTMPNNFAEKLLVTSDPEVFERLRRLPVYQRAVTRQQLDALGCVTRVLIRTGRRVEQLTGEDLLFYADVVKTSGRHRREHLAWELLVALGPFRDEPPTLRAAWSAKGNTRQHSAATLVDRYGIPPSGVRDLLVDYLGEVKAGMDYGSLQGLAYRLVRLFWWEVLQLNPGQTTLHLPPATVTAWRERLALTSDGRPRREIHSTLFAVRAFYRDLVEWGHDDPIRWGVWVAPCPISRLESRNAAKARRQQRSRTQARTVALTPLLPALVAEAARKKDRGARLLTAAESAADGEQFVIDTVTFQRAAPPPRHRSLAQRQVWATIVDASPAAAPVHLERGKVNITRLESDEFWAWAIVETLRHTGIRVEELMELTQLSLRHYTSAKTGTLVPLLHIVPSKTDVERLVPMSPELVTVLLAVQRRAKGDHVQIPVAVRYDHHERTHGQPLPHLFSRRVGTRQEVLSAHAIRRLLNDLAAGAGLTDAGQPVTFTPHDFRRLFTTDMVNGGLPLHIAATLLGHLSLETTRGYTAVFPEQVITAHQAFIERRRQLRPGGEMRPATGEEWQEFEDHLLLRKVALGDCHRPYGTTCVHEHACARCRFLRVDPAQLPRIEEMTINAEARLDEARSRTWLGEVAALEETLQHLKQRHTEASARLATPHSDAFATLEEGN